MPKVTIDLDLIGQLTDEAGQVVFTPEAENALEQLLDLQEVVENSIKYAKKIIEKNALDYNSSFTGLKTDKFKISYRAYGGRYALEEAYIDQLPETLYKKTIRYTPDPKAVDQYVEENDGQLPEGIAEVEREKQISIRRLDVK